MNKNDIVFIRKPTLDFAAAMYILANGDKNLALSKELGVEPDQLLIKMGENGAKVFSTHMQEELHFFMDYDACSISGITPVNAILFTAALEHPEIEDVPDLVKHLENQAEDYFIYLMAKNALGLHSQEEFMPDALAGYIENLPPEDSSFGSKLRECLQNPLEIKIRFCLLIRQFYTLVYQPFESEIHAVVEACRPYYEHLLDTDFSGFVSDYFGIDTGNYNKKLDIYLSLFFQVGLLMLHWDDGRDVAILGIHANRRFGYEVTKKLLGNFYKLLADEKRFQLLELLADRPKYVNELAELLKLAPSTVSHHLSYFIRTGIVTPSRDEHKLYYALDRKKIRELFERSIKMFLKE